PRFQLHAGGGRRRRAGCHPVVPDLPVEGPADRRRPGETGRGRPLPRAVRDHRPPAVLHPGQGDVDGHAKRVVTGGRPWWLRHFLNGPPITFKNLEPYGFQMSGGVLGLSTFMRQRLNNPATTWADLRWLRGLWDGPMVVKGVLTADAARRCFDAGADAVVCSNHGGRQLNGNPASLDALPEVLSAAADRGKEVFLDGGVRRGTDVVKA